MDTYRISQYLVWRSFTTSESGVDEALGERLQRIGSPMAIRRSSSSLHGFSTCVLRAVSWVSVAGIIASNVSSNESYTP